MTCEKFAEMLDNYESLTDEEKALMSEHANVCEACRRELDFMRSMINAVRTLPEIKVPDDFLENLNKRIDAEETPTRRSVVAGHILHNWQKYSAVAACLVLAVVIGTNYNTLMDGMNGDDDGVISTVTTVTSPVPDNGAAIMPAVTPGIAADNNAASVKDSDKRTDENRAGIQNVGPARSGAGANSVRQSGQNTGAAGNTVPQATVQAKIGDMSDTAATPQAIKGSDTGVETMTLPRSVYVEGRGARSIMPMDEAETQEDNTYAINAESAPDEEYAVAPVKDAIFGSSGTSNAEEEDNGLGYSLNQNNMIIVNGEDFATAFDIISHYVSDSYNNYFMVTAGKLDAMLSALDEAGVRYRSTIGFNADKITFRISIE